MAQRNKLPTDGHVFGATRWSIVMAAGRADSPDAKAALEQLCKIYWHPLYCCVRRHGYSPEDSQDFTQGFLAKLLEKNGIASADQNEGRFRTFLLRSLENFLHNEHEWRNAKKRGGGAQLISIDEQEAEKGLVAEPSGQLSPAQLYERKWATTLLRHVLNRLREGFCANGKLELFDFFEPRLWGDASSETYAEAGKRLGMTEGNLKVTITRLRQRFRELLREEVAHTVASPEEVDAELAYLMQVLAS